MGPVLVERRKQGVFGILQYAPPGGSVSNIGVVLLDPGRNEARVRMRDGLAGIAGEDDREYLELLEEDLQAKANEMGGGEFFASLEETLSNILLLTGREAVEIRGGLGTECERLLARHVEAPAVAPFVTHLPLVSLRAAAGGFGEDMEVSAEEWLRIPPRLRPDRNMFVAQVVGRSMEPRIPDGSLCVFRGNVVGSRQGKLVLVELRGVTDSSARYTVKRYTSAKTVSEEGWEHASIRLEPLNPEYPPLDLQPDQFQVIGEFVQVLD